MQPVPVFVVKRMVLNFLEVRLGLGVTYIYILLVIFFFKPNLLCLKESCSAIFYYCPSTWKYVYGVAKNRCYLL